MSSKPTNTQFAEIFDQVANSYDQITNLYAVEKRKKFFLEHALGKCLEVGAGTAEISKALKNKHQVVATDISPKMVNEIKKKLKIQAVVCDAEKLPFRNNEFETVIGAEMIYYLDHPENFIKEAKRVLKPKGRLLLSSANDDTRFYDSLRAMLRKLGLGSMYFDDKNREFMSEEKISRLLESQDFEIVELKKVMVLPFKFLDKFNKILEITPIKHFGAFIFVYARKK